jgi:hypothetical protein
MHTMNFYLNFTPIQEISDWFEHWANKGVKPLFPCEYGVPFSWDWTMYRGWYKGQREWGSAKVPWEFCLAEWSAQFLGDRGYKVSEAEKRNLRWEAKQFQAGNLWHRWDYPTPVGSSAFDEPQEIFARYITDNWRAHRTWGISANSPWEYAAFWKLRDGLDRRRKELKVDWENLQKPGFSPDYVQPRQGWMSVDGEASDWVATKAAEALVRNNQPLLAYIAGPPGSVTSKGHNFYQGETIEKQLVLVNNSREIVECDCEWHLGRHPGSKKITVRAGDQERIPMRFTKAETMLPGTFEFNATVRFGDRETQKDSFPINILNRPENPVVKQKIALFDPTAGTARVLDALGFRFQRVDQTADLSGYDMLIIGKEVLTLEKPGPDVSRVRDGMKIIVFEQSAESLEKRFGFRVAEYGLREVFLRVSDHPFLEGIKPDYLRDWRGEATLLPPRLKYTLRPRYGPTVKWCGIEVPRAWRAGCRGSVASVLIEKPTRGDFLPVIDGGYSLQYTPLLEYREGEGMVLFCQMDVIGRTEREPAAEALLRNILLSVSRWKPTPRRKALYVGDPLGKKHLESAGLSLTDYTKNALTADRVLIVGPGGGKELAGDAAALGAWLKDGGHLLAIGLDGAETELFLPSKVETKKGEHIASYFNPPGAKSLLAGIGPADVHNRDPRELPLVTAGAEILGNGILAKADKLNIVFCQFVPWQFDSKKPMNQKRTFRRASYLVTRLAANMGVAGSTPLLARFRNPVEASKNEQRWLDGLYLDTPEEWDDPYRFFRW